MRGIFLSSAIKNGYEFRASRVLRWEVHDLVMVVQRIMTPRDVLSTVALGAHELAKISLILTGYNSRQLFVQPYWCTYIYNTYF